MMHAHDKGLDPSDLDRHLTGTYGEEQLAAEGADDHGGQIDDETDSGDELDPDDDGGAV